MLVRRSFCGALLFYFRCPFVDAVSVPAVLFFVVCCLLLLLLFCIVVVINGFSILLPFCCCCTILLRMINGSLCLPLYLFVV